jgi:hypothetical protein
MKSPCDAYCFQTPDAIILSFSPFPRVVLVAAQFATKKVLCHAYVS